VITLSNIMYD